MTDRIRIDPAVWLASAAGRRTMQDALTKLDESETRLDQKRRPWHYQAARAIFLDLPKITERCEFDAAFAIWSIAKIMQEARP